jgi:FemAB-related protein (PEP-CTERM system-associated)
MLIEAVQNKGPPYEKAAGCVRVEEAAGAGAWDAFVQSHPQGTLYHLFAWKHVVEKTYGHQTYYLTAVKEQTAGPFQSVAVLGVLPLFHLHHFLFGNSLVSIPFFDMGGVLADEGGAEEALVAEAVRLGKKLNVENIELRHRASALCPQGGSRSAHKVRMLLDLPASAEALMKGFKSKLRSQIGKAIKDGLCAEIGGEELLNDFYRVFLVNMRDLGSPVHSRRLMENVFKHFPNDARVVVVRYQKQAVAGSIVVGFEEVLENPWASALRRFSHLNANMLLYWTMLEYACEKGFRKFDFGRSTPDEGTYKFKAQWGAKPEPLNWMSISLNGGGEKSSISEDSKFQMASQIWKKLPVPVTRLIGPRIRKYISL